ncbi:hypothetical protein DFJ74DRAFT_701741 [Hyaloraphidium curvatum]|nr:hypothetical protein DFJ74DRAFT_701741 [Hyaloraphidium curvatum]
MASDSGESPSPIPNRRLKRRRNALDSTPDESQRAAQPSEPLSPPRPKRPAARGRIKGFGSRIFDVEARTGRKRGAAEPSQSDEEDGSTSGADDSEEGGEEDLDADLPGFVVSDDCNDSQLYRSSAPDSEEGSGGSSSDVDPYLVSMLSQVPANFASRRQPIQSKFTTRAGQYGGGRFHMKWDVKAENHYHLDEESSAAQTSEDPQSGHGMDDAESGTDPSRDPSRGPSRRHSGNMASPDHAVDAASTCGFEPDAMLGRNIMVRGGDYQSHDCSLFFERILRLCNTGYCDD